MALACVIAAGAYAYVPVGSDFRISNVDTDAARDGNNPSVAYNSTANEYLVTWSGDGLASATNDEFEIFGQRLSAAGAELGADFRISNVTEAGIARDGINPSVAYSSSANEYLVAWEGDGLATNDEFEIFGHRLAPAATPPAGTPPSKCKKKKKKKKKGKAVVAKKKKGCKKKKKKK